jgi:carboxypeptidase Q
MTRIQWGALALGTALLAGTAVAAAPPVDAQTINAIADQGFNHGEVAETAEYLADQIGGRMTNSPAMRKAEAWTQERYKAWGLTNVRKQPFEFGRGWWIESSSVRMVAPRPIMLRAIPVAWSPPTDGPLSAPIVVAPLRSPRDFAAWRGKLKGKIVLTSQATPPADETKPAFARLDDAAIAKLNVYQEGSYDPEAAGKRAERVVFRRQLDEFLAAEGALANATMSRNDDGLIHGDGGSGYKVGQTLKLPAVEISAEDYRRLARLAKVGEVKLEIDARVHFDDTDTKANNILADIPGSDPKAGYVMAGAHLDSWVAGDGATDNGAGSAVVMEAARILSALHVKPKRAIRFALWAGEEQGLLGSAAYVDEYLAKHPNADPKLADLGPFYASESWPAKPLPGFNEMQGYFNIDNGSGKIRGIFAEGNFAAAPILKDWLAPFASLGATAVVAEPTGSTDHVFMVKLGLPAFQFIQDPLDYGSHTHHTNLDTFDHLRPEDLRQAAVILATVLLDAANAETPLPRNVLPTQPRPTDPFRYPDPTPN